MAREHVTAEAVRRAITDRIGAGRYAPGERLPSVRALAAELGANRNTVNKAYRALQTAGLIELPPGRNAFRVRVVPPPSALLADLRSQARAVVWRAMAGGIPGDAVRAELSAAVAEVYGRHELRIRFYECNPHDSEQLSAELAQLTGVPIVPGLLAELAAGAEAIAAEHDLVVTTFHHLAEVTRALAPHTERVVGVNTRPAHAVLLELARQSPARVGLVCTLDNTASMLRHIIYSYQPSCEVASALADDSAAVRRLAAEPNLLVVTHTCAEQVQALTGRAPDLVVEFRIDDQSSLFLRQRIQTLRQRKAEELGVGAAA